MEKWQNETGCCMGKNKVCAEYHWDETIATSYHRARHSLAGHTLHDKRLGMAMPKSRGHGKVNLFHYHKDFSCRSSTKQLIMHMHCLCASLYS